MKMSVEKPLTFLRGKTIDTYKKEVEARNLDYLRSFARLGLCTTFFTIIYGQIMRNVVTFNTEFFLLFIYFILMCGITLFMKRHTSHIIIVLYLWLTPLMLMGILMGTFLDPNEPSITIMVFLCVLPLFILDKPWRVLLFITVVAVVYVICCFAAKAEEHFVADMIDLVLFYILGMGINGLILRDRIRNVEYAVTMRITSETDALTDLYNRGAGEQKIKEHVAEKQGGMFCILDIDDFKTINDLYGHMMGDRVLQLVAGQLRENFRASDVVMRMGGDEFAVYALGITDISAGTVWIDHLFRAIEQTTALELPTYKITISLGGAFFTVETGEDFEALYHKSDAALYNAKRNGKGQYCF